MPRRPSSHILEDQSRSRLAALFHDEGWTVEHIKSDYGEDLLVRVFDASVATPFLFFVQAKAYSRTDHLLVKKREYLSIPVDADHLATWSLFREPVVLTVWDAQHDKTYWQTIQIATSVTNRRARHEKQLASRTRVWIPVRNVLKKTTVGRLASRARAAWEHLQREREGARRLKAELSEQLNLQIEYDPLYGIITIPAGTFVADAQRAPTMSFFGRAARDFDRIANILGVSRQDAFDITMRFVLTALSCVEAGLPATVPGPNGQVVDLFRTVEEVNKSIYRMFEDADED